MIHGVASFGRILCFIVAFLSVSVGSSSRGRGEELKQDRRSAERDNSITVKIQANKRFFIPGENVSLHVEIRNTGSKDIFVEKNFSLYGGSLEILLHYGTKIDGPSERVSIDYLPGNPNDPKKPPLVNELSRYWIALPPGHFYGGEVILDSRSFKRLWVPGRYRIEGQYHSGGFFVPDDYGNPLASYAEELKQLPYHAWEGRVANEFSLDRSQRKFEEVETS
jgi:hypothetical protein